MLQSMLNEMLTACRSFKRAGWVNVAGVVTLGLGLGFAGALLATLQGVVLAPLPYPNSSRLLRIAGIAGPPGSEPVDWWSHEVRSLETLAQYRSGNVSIMIGRSPERVIAAQVSTNFFAAFGAPPSVGRVFHNPGLPTETIPLAVVSDSLWTRALNRDPTVIGKTISVSRVVYTIVGVMPSTFRFPGNCELWLTRGSTASDLNLTRAEQPGLPLAVGMGYIGCLRIGATIGQATDELNATLRRVNSTYSPRTHMSYGEIISVKSLREAIVGDVRNSVEFLFFASLLLLVSSCVAATGLFLTRASSRQAEIAMRVCLGASRGHIYRQLAAETLVVSIGAVIAGSALTSWFLAFLPVVAPPDIPRLSNARWTWQVIALVTTCGLVTACISSFFPAIRFFNRMGRITPASRVERGDRIRQWLLVGEIAIAVVLMVGAALSVRSYDRFRRLQLGFDASDVTTAQLAFSKARYATPHQYTSALRTVLEALRETSDVALGMTSTFPFTHAGAYYYCRSGNMSRDAMAAGAFIEGEYFRAMRIPLLAGRVFDTRDRSDSQQVVIINQAMANLAWPHASPFGQPLSIGSKSRVVIGVVADVLQGPAPEPQIYLPYEQTTGNQLPPLDVTVVARTQDRAGFTERLRHAIGLVDTEVPIFNVTPGTDRVADFVAPIRFRAWLLGIASLVTLMLSLFGVYAAMSYTVARRQFEIGVRMALGARPNDVLTTFLRAALKIGSGGVVIGVALATVFTQLMSTLLFGVKPSDPASFALVAAVLLGGVIVACAIPAWRAANVDPAVVLRHD
jgi:putative ABC transport system permease protein